MSATKKTSGLDAAAKVLSLATVPLNVQTVVERSIDKGLWKTKGKTPTATIYAAIIREIEKKGKEARFYKVARGLFTANDEDHKKAAKEHIEAEAKAEKAAAPKVVKPKAEKPAKAAPTPKAAAPKAEKPATPKVAKKAKPVAPKAAPEAPKAETPVTPPETAPAATEGAVAQVVTA